jgi:hypothetical protein
MLQQAADMQVIFNTSPVPRLLDSAVEAPPVTKPPKDQIAPAPVIQAAAPSSGHGRAVFLRIVLGVSVLLAGAFLYSRHQATKIPEAVTPGFITVSVPGQPKITITPAMIHVTAVSLGKPRLALINGQQAGEGDHVTVRLSTSDAVKLEVLRIADGEVEIGDERQSITARVEAPTAKNPKRP